MFARRDNAHTLGERGVLGDEELAALLATVADLQALVADLKERVDSQFTTIAAHAEIAREQTELVRAEARSDLERSRETMIGLIEHVRAEAGGHHVAGSAPGASIAATHRRVDEIEAHVETLATTIERSLTRQNDLADTVAAFLDTIVAEQRGEPVAGLSLT